MRNSQRGIGLLEAFIGIVVLMAASFAFFKAGQVFIENYRMISERENLKLAEVNINNLLALGTFSNTALQNTIDKLNGRGINEYSIRYKVISVQGIPSSIDPCNPPANINTFRVRLPDGQIIDSVLFLILSPTGKDQDTFSLNNLTGATATVNPGSTINISWADLYRVITIDSYRTKTCNIKDSLSSSLSTNYVSRYFVGTSRPNNPFNGDLFYETTTNRLFRWNGTDWTEINWRDLISQFPEYQTGRLRINPNSGNLEISPNGSNWFTCYPLVGAMTFRLMNVDNTSYSLKYYLPPGATAIIDNANHVPIVYSPNVVPMFFFQIQINFGSNIVASLRPSNITITNGDFQVLWGSHTVVTATRITRLNAIPLYDHSNVSENWAHITLTIRENQRWLTLSQSQVWGNFEVGVSAGSGTAPSTSHWLGTWYGNNGQQFIADFVSITRRR